MMDWAIPTIPTAGRAPKLPSSLSQKASSSHMGLETCWAGTCEQHTEVPTEQAGQGFCESSVRGRCGAISVWMDLRMDGWM